MRSTLFVLVFISLALSTQAQQAFSSVAFQEKRQMLFRQHTLGVGGWALGNLAYSGGILAWGNSKGSTLYAHRGNLAWNMVNLLIVAPAYIKNRKEQPAADPWEEVIREQLRMERILLANAVLNVSYMVTGVALHSRGQQNNNPMAEGFGRSLLIQGSFLLLADGITFFRLKNHSDGLWEQLEMRGGPNGLGLSFKW
jgi:hypothetical protein